MDNETPWVITVRSEMVLTSWGYEMYPALVYQSGSGGSFSATALYGDGDPDITIPGQAKIVCQVQKIVADAIRAAVDPVNGPIWQVYEDHAVGDAPSELLMMELPSGATVTEFHPDGTVKRIEFHRASPRPTPVRYSVHVTTQRTPKQVRVV